MALLKKPVVAVAAAKLNEEMGEFASVSRKITPESKGKGSQIQVYVNRPSEVVAGVSIPPGFDQGSEKQVNIQLNPYFTTKWVNTVEKTNDLIEEEEQILAPLRVGIQHEAKKQFLNLGIATANTAITATSTATSPFQMADIAKAIAQVKMSGVGGKVHVLIPSDAAAIAAGSQWSMFTAGPNEKLFNNDLGSFYGATWHETNISGVRSPLTSGVALAASPVEGQTWLDVTGVTSGVLIPAGTQFTIAGVYAVDIYGNTLPTLANFATVIDVLPSGTTASLPIGKALFSKTGTQSLVGPIPGSSGLNWNASPTNPQDMYQGAPTPSNGLAFVSALPSAGAALTPKSSSTGSIVVYSELALAFAAASPNEMARKEEHLIRPGGGIPILVGVQGTNESGVANYRMDAIWGLSGVYAPGACVVNYALS